MRDQTPISQLISEYLSTQRRLEPATRTLSVRAFDYLVRAVGDQPAAAFAYEHALRFQTWLIDQGLGQASANTYCRTARPVFRWAMRTDRIDGDPFGHLALFRVPKNRLRIYEAAEVAALLDACRDPLWRLRILLAATAGLRRGEALNLTVEDVDFDAGLLWVQPKRDTAWTWAWQVKDKDRRQVPLADPAARLLQRQLLDLPAGQPYLCLTPRRYRRLIGLKRAGRLADRLRVCPDENFTKPFGRIGKRAGVSGSFHDLRRTCITCWLERGLAPHEVMALAGHADLATTMRYYVATRRTLIAKARRASELALEPATPVFVPADQRVIGATGLEPATS